MATGTFTGTGQSAAVTGRKIAIRMDFSGAASVDIEVAMPSGAWVKSATGIIADYDNIYAGVVTTGLRLNCTAYTDDVEYYLEALD
jgi:hypothetical protein